MIKPLPRLDWNHLRAFLATAEHGTLSAAARQLGLTQPTLSRQVAALEADLHVLLFDRAGQRLTLTDAGRTLRDQARAMGNAADRISLLATGQRSDLKGCVRITAVDVLAVDVLPAVAAEVRKLAPLLTIEVIATNDISNLMRREADIAIRNLRPDQPDLVARLVSDATAHYYAHTDYLARVGRPATLAQMSQMDWVTMGRVAEARAYMARMGLDVPAQHIKVSSDNGLVAWEMCKAGLGICPMDDAVAAKTPGVEAVLPDLLAVTYPLWLVTHREVHTSPRIRLVFDVLDRVLSAR